MYRDELRLTANPREVVIQIAREQRLFAQPTSKHHALNHMLIARTRQVVEVEQNNGYGFQNELVESRLPREPIRCGRQHFEALVRTFHLPPPQAKSDHVTCLVFLWVRL